VNDTQSAKVTNRTMASNIPRSRDWCFTLNNPAVIGAIDCSAKASADALWAQAASKNARYMVLQLERGEGTDNNQGTPHFQGYLVFKQAKQLGGVKLVNGQAHWEPRKRTHEQVLSSHI